VVFWAAVIPEVALVACSFLHLDWSDRCADLLSDIGRFGRGTSSSYAVAGFGRWQECTAWDLLWSATDISGCGDDFRLLDVFYLAET
jgi:hypothetical protein